MMNWNYREIQLLKDPYLWRLLSNSSLHNHYLLLVLDLNRLYACESDSLWIEIPSYHLFPSLHIFSFREKILN
jgi:hypothetical protein